MFCKKRQIHANSDVVDKITLYYKADTNGDLVYEDKSQCLKRIIDPYIGNELAVLQADLDYHGHIKDWKPIWDSDGSKIYLFSNREHFGGPWWDRTSAIVVYSLEKNTINYLYPAFETDEHNGRIRDYTYSSLTNSLIFMTDDKINSINLRSGVIRKFQQERGEIYNIESGGGYIVWYTNDMKMRKHVDLISKLDKATSLPLTADTVLKNYGNPILLLSQDARTAYYVDVLYRHADGSISSLLRENVADRHGETPLFVLKKISIVNPLAKSTINDIATFETSIERINAFPGDSKLLVSSEGNLYIVDLLKKNGAVKLICAGLKDPDTNIPLKCHEAAVSPDGKKIVFVGKYEGQRDYNQIIYISNIDGTQLRCLTSKTETVVQPYTFPEAKN